ncbi:MAG: carbohydrate kinase family protein [Paracoccaceae bacterium]
MTRRAQRRGVLSVGRAYCDLIFTGLPRLPSMGTEVFAGGLGVHTGGGAPITAAHLALLGRPSALAAVLPVEPFATLVQRDLSAVGVDLRLSRAAPPGSDLQATVAMTDAGDRAFLTRRTGPAAPLPSPQDLLRMDIGHMHVGELTTLVELPELVEIVAAAGVSLSLDCSWDDEIDAKAAAPLIAAVDVFLPNAAEAAQLAGQGLQRPFAPLTVIKSGAEGATAETGQGRQSAPAFAAEVVDTTGAGDAFNAGFLNAWLDGGTVEACLRAGNAAGAKAVSTRGGFACADARDDVRARQTEAAG